MPLINEMVKMIFVHDGLGRGSKNDWILLWHIYPQLDIGRRQIKLVRMWMCALRKFNSKSTCTRLKVPIKETSTYVTFLSCEPFTFLVHLHLFTCCTLHCRHVALHHSHLLTTAETRNRSQLYRLINGVWCFYILHQTPTHISFSRSIVSLLHWMF